MAFAALVAWVQLGCLEGGEVPSLTSTTIEMKTVDGVTLIADRYASNETFGPSLILIHEKGSGKEVWKSLAEGAQRIGFTVVCFDMRGHGESVLKNGQPIDFKEFTTKDWRGVSLDLDAVVERLITDGADPSRMGVVGAGLGANLALRYAAERPAVHSVVLISPGRVYEGIGIQEPLQSFNRRPLLVLAAENDPFSAQSAQEIQREASGYAELRMYPGPAHGVELLHFSNSARAQILQWLETVFNLQPRREPAEPNAK